MRFVWVSVLVLGLSTSANPASLQAGDVIVSTGSSIVHLDPLLDRIETFHDAEAGLYGVEVDEEGQILVGGGDSVRRLDPETGEVTIVSQGGVLSGIQGIAATTNGIFVTNNRIFAGVVRVDPVTGEQTPLGDGLNFQMADIDSAPDGALFVSTPNGEIFRVDADTGEESHVASMAPAFLLGIAFVPGTHDLLVAHQSRSQIWKVDTLTGIQTLVHRRSSPLDVAIDGSGAILATVLNESVGGIVRIDPMTGEETLGGAEGFGIVVVPGELPDGDGDGRSDRFDNCVDDPNADQTDRSEWSRRCLQRLRGLRRRRVG